MQKEVTQIFDARLRKKLATAKPEVLRFLLTHERRTLCISNICLQIQVAEKANHRVQMNRFKYKAMIEAVADMFAKNAVQAHVDSLMTAAAKGARMEQIIQADHFDKAIAQANHEAFNPKPRIVVPGARDA